jgi:hypothetical protein
MDPRTAAALNNAAWCDAVCRAHGIDTRTGDDVWVALRRSPPLYPDAVTLTDRVRPADVLPWVDGSPGCSIKDSFAALDLAAEGFRVLFEAEWIHRPPAPPATADDLVWAVVRTPQALRGWGAAHGGGDVFHPALLDDPAVAILGGWQEDTLVGGVIANRIGAAVGISNLFTTIDPDDFWASVVAVVTTQFPGLPMVGYEDGSSLAAAQRAGFTSVGGLRVWLNESTAG